MSSVDWPPNLERRTADDRTYTHKFDVTLARAFSELEDELERVGVDDYRYSFDAEARKRDGRPYADARPDDPSFVLRWTSEGEQYAVGCDAYTSLRDNVRAVGLYVREKRKMEGRPVATAASEFATAKLPPAGDDAIAAPAATTEPSEAPHEVLQVAPDASGDVVRAAARRLSADAHPDRADGDEEQFKLVQRAKDAMLKN